MGLYDREYYRNTPVSGGFLGGATPACNWLIAINVAVHILQVLTFERADALQGEISRVTTWLQLSPNRVVEDFQVWRLLTYAFCHSDLFHLVGNMIFLWICGRNIEPIYGPREFVRFYLTAAVFSGLCFTAFCYVIGRMDISVGASGAVMAVVVVCAMYYPTQEILMFFVIPVQLRWLVLVYLVFDLYPVLQELGGAQPFSRIAHSAHLGGLLYGYLYKRYDLRFSRLSSGLSWPRFRQLVRSSSRRNPNVRLYQPPDERRQQADLERQVDEILAKITAQGESSLTDAERNILKEASQRYKRR